MLTNKLLQYLEHLCQAIYLDKTLYLKPHVYVLWKKFASATFPSLSPFLAISTWSRTTKTNKKKRVLLPQKNAIMCQAELGSPQKLEHKIITVPAPYIRKTILNHFEQTKTWTPPSVQHQKRLNFLTSLTSQSLYVRQLINKERGILTTAQTILSKIKQATN